VRTACNGNVVRVYNWWTKTRTHRKTYQIDSAPCDGRLSKRSDNIGQRCDNVHSKSRLRRIGESSARNALSSGVSVPMTAAGIWNTYCERVVRVSRSLPRTCLRIQHHDSEPSKGHCRRTCCSPAPSPFLDSLSVRNRVHSVSLAPPARTCLQRVRIDSRYVHAFHVLRSPSQERPGSS